ncbi:MAG: hypothetical protein AB9919_14755 [Geobacteraceae bacterium]
MKSMIAIGIILVTFFSGGCAAKVPTTGEKMMSQNKDAIGLGEEWNAGHKAFEGGRELKHEGQQQVEKAQKDLTEGMEKIKEGDRKVTEGAAIMRAAEKKFAEQFPHLKLQ